MVIKILDAISIKLNKEFGDNYRIYSEDVKQGFKEPCFFISLIKPTSKNMLGQRKLREYNFVIQYFPKESNEKKLEIYEVIEKLETELENIESEEGLIRGQVLNSEIVDNVLHFFVRYSLFTTTNVTHEKFGELKLKQRAKGVNR